MGMGDEGSSSNAMSIGPSLSDMVAIAAMLGREHCYDDVIQEELLIHFANASDLFIFLKNFFESHSDQLRQVKKAVLKPLLAFSLDKIKASEKFFEPLFSPLDVLAKLYPDIETFERIGHIFVHRPDLRYSLLQTFKILNGHRLSKEYDVMLFIDACHGTLKEQQTLEEVDDPIYKMVHAIVDLNAKNYFSSTRYAMICKNPVASSSIAYLSTTTSLSGEFPPSEFEQSLYANIPLHEKFVEACYILFSSLRSNPISEPEEAPPVIHKKPAQRSFIEFFSFEKKDPPAEQQSAEATIANPLPVPSVNEFLPVVLNNISRMQDKKHMESFALGVTILSEAKKLSDKMLMDLKNNPRDAETIAKVRVELPTLPDKVLESVIEAISSMENKKHVESFVRGVAILCKAEKLSDNTSNARLTVLKNNPEYAEVIAKILILLSTAGEIIQVESDINIIMTHKESARIEMLEELLTSVLLKSPSSDHAKKGKDRFENPDQRTSMLRVRSPNPLRRTQGY